tara:strand:- start:10447 stop:10875 length:429 start_codon:yes stop_codon:yes gene_type:complete
MSDITDPWKALHAKRTRKSIKSKTADPFGVWRMTPTPSVSPPKPKKQRKAPPIVKTPRKAATPPDVSRSMVQEPTRFDFSDPRSSSPSRPTKSESKTKERYLVSIDMVSDENRELVRLASKSEGRTLSQWARRILLAEASKQ